MTQHQKCKIENCKGEHCSCCGVHIRLDPNNEDRE